MAPMLMKALICSIFICPEHKGLAANNTEASPLIVFIHGGAWQSGDKSMAPNPSDFTRRGYALASINYRLIGQTSHPAQIEDCEAAINWLRAHAATFRLDPNRIGVWGMSAGGHLAALLGTTCSTALPPWKTPGESPCRVQAVCDWCGPANLTTISRQAGSNYVLAPAVKLFLGGTPSEKSRLAKKLALSLMYARDYRHF